jgi:protein-S-isoprenylcysteine O-methyltransferase Ste14
MGSRWIYRFRGYLVSPPLIFSLVWFRWEIEAEYFIWPLGIGLVLIGVILRIWAQQHLHYRLKFHKSLTATGPYLFVRNPIYIGNTLICLGVTVTSELLWFCPITVFWCLGIYSFVVRYEEAHLSEKYGDAYREYRGEVPRWFPRGPHFENLGLINENFGSSISCEVWCLLILIPYILKDALSPILEG